MTKTIRLQALGCALAALALAGTTVASILVSNNGHASVLVRMSAAEPMAQFARQADPSFDFVPVQDHYDGVYFYAIAMDPLARGPQHAAIDQAAYRYSHAGFGLLAWLFAAGYNHEIPIVLLVLNLLGVAVGAAAASLIASHYGRSGWWGLAIALSPGLVYAVTADTSEPVGIALAAAGVLAWLSRKRIVAAVLLSVAVLCKEPFLVVPLGLLAWEGIQGWRARTSPLSWQLMALVAPIAVFGGWQVYIRTRFGMWGLFAGKQVLQLSHPLRGWFDAIRFSNFYSVESFDRMTIGTIVLPLLLVFGMLLLIGSVRSLFLRSPFALMFLAVAILSMFLSWLALFYPKDLLRWSSIPLALLPGVFIDARAPARSEQPVDEPAPEMV